MMEAYIFILGFCFMLAISIVDILTYNKKNGYIPAVLTTLFLIIALISGGAPAIFIGVLASLIGLLLTDLDFWDGIADFKVFVGAGMLFPNFLEMLYFAGCMTFIAIIFRVIVKRIVKREDWKIPFIPIITASFVVTHLALRMLIK